MKRTFIIDCQGRVHTVYCDDLRKLDLGPQRMQRASVLEWDDPSQEWVAYRLTPTGDRGSVLAHGPDRVAVEAKEREMLELEL
jgi:hypothetical protein